MHKVLSLIIEAKKKKVKILEKSKKELLSLAKKAPKVLSFAKAIEEARDLSIIAEIKQASPSSGLLRKDFNLSQIIKDYKEAGVQALSVLTEEEFFLGKIKYLEEVKKETSLPILRKDFIIDEIQVIQSRALGADAILLIVKILKPEVLKKLYTVAKDLGMDVILEVHTLAELKIALSLSSKLIGINNRNLDTFETDLGVTLQLTPLISHDTLVISESGIETFKDVLLLKGAGVDAVLIGEALMRAKDIKEKLKEFQVGCKE